MMTTKKIATGEFAVFWNGEETKWTIINGSRGLSGRNTQNVYGIAGPNVMRWVGSLTACKKALAFAMKRDAVKAAEKAA